MLVKCDGRETLVHVANSGRIAELLRPDNLMLIAPAPGPNRKTAYDLALVRIGDIFVSADARLPNPLVQEAIEGGSLRDFTGYDTLRREVTLGHSRLDFLLTGTSGKCYLEVKSVTLVENGVALFPDAPTERGRKHLQSLIAARKDGNRAAVVFVVQRPDADSFSPYKEADRDFWRTLRRASRAGVEVHAYRCRVSRQEVEIDAPIPVEL